MAQPNSVKLVQVCRVAPHPGTPDSATPDDQSLPLTSFDLHWLRFPPVQRLYFYEMPTSSEDTKRLCDSILIPKLKTSLSIALRHFLPLAGNLTWPQDSPKPILSYAIGDTTLLTIAESDDDFYHLISSNNFDIEAKAYHPLVPQLVVSDERAAVMALQVTVFPNRGFSIGTSMHHAVLDGKTSTMFVKSWARICKHGDGEPSSSLLSRELKQCYDRMAIKHSPGLEAIYSNDWLNAGGPNNRSLKFLEIKEFPLDSIRRTFEFTRAKTEALRKPVMAMMEKKKKQHNQSVLHLSTFSITCAYTWVCLVRAEEVKEEKVVLIFTVDCRSRLDPPLPASYFGNCIAIHGAVAETKDLLGEDGFSVALNAISVAIKCLDKTLLDAAETWVSRMLNAVPASTTRVLPTAGSHRFGMYEAADFGWGRPRKTEVFSIDGTGAFSFSDSKNGNGGVEVGLVLKKHYMDAFALLFAKGLEDV